MKKSDWLRIKYFVYCLVHRNGYKHAEYLRKHNAFYEMGEQFFFQPFNLPADSKLIRLGNNVVIASNVSFICHDVIHHMFNNNKDYSGVEYKTYWDIVDVKDNVFIGSNVTLLPGITIGSNSIIAAGAVITNNVPNDVVVAGVPARIIGRTEDLKKKRCEYSKTSLAQKSKDEIICLLWSQRR